MTDRIEFLFGTDHHRFDLDDPDTRRNRLIATWPDISKHHADAAQRVADLIHADDPLELWATVERLLQQGVEPGRAFFDVVVAHDALFEPASRSAVSEDEVRARIRAWFDAELPLALGQLPLPTSGEISDAIDAVARTRAGDEDDLCWRVSELLGWDDDGVLAVEVVPDLIDRQVRAMLDRDQLVELGDGEIVALAPHVLGRVFTHVLTAPELDHGVLLGGPDLAPVLPLLPASLIGGSGVGAMVEVALPGPGGRRAPGPIAEMREIPRLVTGPTGWLRGFIPGDVLTISVSTGPILELGRQAVVGAPSPALVAMMAEAFADRFDGSSLPARAIEVLADVLVAHRGAFTSAQAPILAVFAAAGLEHRFGLVADGAEAWESHAELLRSVDRLFLPKPLGSAAAGSGNG